MAVDYYELYLAGIDLWQQGRLAEAIAAWQGSWRLNRHFKTALRLAGAFEKAGDREGALVLLNRVLEKNPSCGPARQLRESLGGMS